MLPYLLTFIPCCGYYFVVAHNPYGLCDIARFPYKIKNYEITKNQLFCNNGVNETKACLLICNFIHQKQNPINYSSH